MANQKRQQKMLVTAITVLALMGTSATGLWMSGYLWTGSASLVNPQTAQMNIAEGEVVLTAGADTIINFTYSNPNNPAPMMMSYVDTFNSSELLCHQTKGSDYSTAIRVDGGAWEDLLNPSGTTDQPIITMPSGDSNVEVKFTVHSAACPMNSTSTWSITGTLN